MERGRLFTGQRLDSCGLYYYNARYYDATIGRFISPDTIIPNPANPQSFNRYSYVLNNPLKYVDPSGHYYNMALYMFNQGLQSQIAAAGPITIPFNATIGIYTTNTGYNLPSHGVPVLPLPSSIPTWIAAKFEVMTSTNQHKQLVDTVPVSGRVTVEYGDLNKVTVEVGVGTGLIPNTEAKFQGSNNQPIDFNNLLKIQDSHPSIKPEGYTESVRSNIEIVPTNDSVYGGTNYRGSIFMPNNIEPLSVDINFKNPSGWPDVWIDIKNIHINIPDKLYTTNK